MLGEIVGIPLPRELRLPKVKKLLAFKKANFRHRLNAGKRCDRITATAPEDQRLLVLKHRDAYISYPVIEELLRRVKQVIFTDPVRAEEMARIALLIAEELDPGLPHVASITLCREFQARCHAHLGNVHRVLCQWKESEFHFKRAMDLLWKGIGDPMIHAEVQSLRGSFLTDRQRFDEAINALQESATLYQELGEQHQAGVVLLNMAAAYCRKGVPDQALPIHLKGVELVDEERNPVLTAAAWNNLARIYLFLGQFEAAESTLQSAPSFYDLFPQASSIHINRTWTEGCVHAGLGRLSEALDRLHEAFEGFRLRRDSYNAALAQIDRMRVLLKQGQLREVEHSARLVLEMLQAEPIAREAQEALRLLLVAASRRQLVESLVDQAAAVLREHPPAPRSH